MASFPLVTDSVSGKVGIKSAQKDKPIIAKLQVLLSSNKDNQQLALKACKIEDT